MGVRNPPKLWGWSVDQAEAALRHHLVHSAKHYLTQAEATSILESVEWQEEEQEDVEEAEIGAAADTGEAAGVGPPRQPAHPPHAKRARGPSVGASSGSGGTEADMVMMARVVGDTVRAALEASRTLQPQALATVATRPAQELTVTVRRAQLQSIVDACTRAGLAARQAQLLSESAARAFGSEAAAVDSCRDQLQGFLR